MVAEWDPAKAQQNVQKHGVSFADAVTALEDERALTERDVSSDDEERWVTMGIDGRVGCSWSCTRGAVRICASFPPECDPEGAASV